MLTAKINAYTYWNAKPHFLLATDTENFWVMYVIESGICRYKIAANNGRAQRGDILICPPNVAFDRQVIEPLSFHFFRFNLQNCLIHSRRLIGQLSDTTQRIYENCNIIHKFEFQFSQEALAVKNHLLTDIFYTFIYANTASCQDLKRTNPDITAVIHYVEENYAKLLRLNDLAAMVNLSPEYFSRKFHRVIGKSISNYIESIRMQHAQELLINTQLTLNEIADQVGYTDGLYFSRKFHQFTKQWPSSFRKNHLL
ncbi:MAG: AraC family transcriptional regulator [Lactobacillus sp.]|nr:AraC family transcriptional regulator [Lactobacillus sp.]